MSTYHQLLYQIVFAPYRREPLLLQPNRNTLFKYITGVIRNQNCHLYQIGGVEDHLHILTSIRPEISIADFVKTIKVSSNGFIKENKLFPGFKNWQEGYGVFTYRYAEKDRLIEYVKNQEEHHRKKTFVEEYVELLNEFGIPFNPKYLP